MEENTFYTRTTNWGKVRSDKPPVGMMLLYRIMGAFMLLGSLLGIVFVILNFKDVEDYAWFLLLVMPIGAAMGYFFLYAAKKLLQAHQALKEEVCEELEEQQAAREEYLKAHPYPEAEEFFKQARDAGIPNLDSKANISRLLLFAKNNGITSSRTEIIDQYNLGKQYVEPWEEKERMQQEQEHMDALQEEELELLEQYTLYADYTEQDKSIRICQDKIRKAENTIWQCEQDEDSVRRGGQATYMLGHQKESSWAVHGGIANGIAGGAAGIAVAIDTERRNQEKRQANANLASNIATLSVMQLEKIWSRKRDAQSDLNYWTAKLEEAKILLCEQLNQKELLEMMHPSVEKYEITETGAIKLKVKLYSTPNLIIFDEVKAVVDGSIKVLLKLNNEVVGSAVCVLPFGGMDGNATVNAICCEPEKKATAYTFDFVPNQLWAVETKSDVFDSWGYEQEKMAKKAAEEESLKRKREEMIRKVTDAVNGKCAVTPDIIEYIEVLNAMKGQGALTVTQILDKMPDPDKLTNQKLSALLRVLAEANIVERTEVKLRSFWEYK